MNLVDQFLVQMGSQIPRYCSYVQKFPYFSPNLVPIMEIGEGAWLGSMDGDELNYVRNCILIICSSFGPGKMADPVNSLLHKGFSPSFFIYFTISW